MLAALAYEDKREYERDELVIRYMLLAQNSKLYEAVFRDRNDDEIDEEDVDWETPQSTEEVQELERLMRVMQSKQVGRDESLR